MTLLGELDALRVVAKHADGLRTKADRKQLAWSVMPFFEWAAQLVVFERTQLEDPVPGPWSVAGGWPRGGPTWTPRTRP